MSEETVEQFLARLEKKAAELLPEMKDSALGMNVLNGWSPDIEEISAQAALEIGLLLLLDKPLIIVAGVDQPLPRGLERAAAEVVRGELGTPEMQAKLYAAVERVRATL